MHKSFFLILIIFVVAMTGCSVSKNYNPVNKFPKQALQEDFSLLRNILEKKHPALYWYTPKDSMDYYFDSLYQQIPDSMTEVQFSWKILAPLTNKIHCGHTSVGMSNNWNKFIKNRRLPSFPLFLKIWADTMVVTGNLDRKSNGIKNGTLITSINGLQAPQLVNRMFQYLPLDGYADNVNYIRISSNFPYYHRNIFGLYKNYSVGYIDSSGKEQTAALPIYVPAIDSLSKRKKSRVKGISRQEIKKGKRESFRLLEMDAGTQTATISLHTFSTGEGRHLRSFIKKSFKQIRENNIKNLIVDLRSNGGGDVKMYIKLTQHIRKTNFKVADSAYAVAKRLAPYSRYVKKGFFNNVGLLFLTKKQQDGNYHFGYWERHVFKPKARNHFDGNVYILTNGPTFSASTLFCNAVKGQANVTIAGEETGGGWHGNSGIMIPDIILPKTKLKVRLPLFKLVQYNHVPKDGRGIPPDILIPPTVEGVRQNLDRKMKIVREMIARSNAAENTNMPETRSEK